MGRGVGYFRDAQSQQTMGAEYTPFGKAFETSELFGGGRRAWKNEGIIYFRLPVARKLGSS